MFHHILRMPTTAALREIGHGIGYKYAHSYPNHYVKQQYLPDEYKDETFYEPDGQGYEKIVG